MINEIIEMYKKMSIGPCAIALAGAHAKGVSDEHSDLDYYLLVDEVLPYEELQALLLTVADKDAPWYITPDFDMTVYGGVIDFRYKGTPVETTVHTVARVKQRVEESLEGRFEIFPEIWTIGGYYTYVYLSELDFIKPIWDPDGVLAAYKEQIKVYPEKLRKSIIECFMDRAGIWLDNFHYESAIARKDFIYTGPIVIQTVLNMAQVIFAINKVYFTGDKKIGAALEKLPYCPALLLENLESLFSAPADVEILQKQRLILRQVRDELQRKIVSQ
ncbi:MAG: DUF4037 domain-containing protein [Defluviitaleaceae bacterium]|nr:DUF4037 domain-containing protein [Defluviitaleaceae bacterium]